MSAERKIVFYNFPGCPYAQRAAITLNETGAKFEEVYIDLANKPEWYHKVNPELKVPAITIDGKTFAESLVIIELLSDLYPEKRLLPSDPFKRASIRFAIEYFATKISSPWYKVLFNYGDETKEGFIKETEAGFTRLGELLREQSETGPYFLGEEYSLADVAIAPFLGRVLLTFKHWVGDYKHKAIQNDKRLEAFVEGILSRPSFKETIKSEEYLIEHFQARFKLPPSGIN
ncbi:glutathione S-transferase [Phycomyces blakesleeanus]|uniref:Glutathione S-transferase n=2 Tax=Phycomyces blakesleeanus TaxID=4837 RepID=A0A163ATB0_PHYB8|nr:hypothetical protein PHYBLDRAFT_186464 [Phycomyces blakesleeanus NRRL 1555(-)]OAD75641.1 hypothetical protein PHYBLDRAFT_186464 [Phycomyces blakesleeanus NRRL 1555(-)]|eukprot:XP_018293681.1 hypothetical protein PHYBLDRAFT_186464 [Phycomyces blakesleeanus NRRL 1555(-)]